MSSPAKVAMRRGYSSGDLGRRPKVATNVTVLVFANLGLLAFFLGGVYYVLAGWDQTAILCVVGYVCCGMALAVPSMTFAQSRGEMTEAGAASAEASAERDPRASWRVMAACLNILGLVLGILGSLLYSPGFDKWATDGKLDPYVSEADFEYLTDKANVIWAVSFLLFPIGSWFFLYDKKMSLKERAEARGVRPPGYFSQELYLYVWIEISLCIFAVGGMMFCFDEHDYLLVGALVLFFIGGSIKAGLMFHELKLYIGGTCDEVRNADEESPLLD